MEKLKKLFLGKRSFSERLVTALFPALALSFTLFMFGPLDLGILSRDYVPWSVFQLLPYVLGVWAAGFLILWLPASILGGKVHAGLVSFMSGLSLAFYLQGTYLNPNLGVLDGHTIAWEKYTGKALLGLGIWAVILLIPFVLHYFSRKVWKKTVLLFTGTLVLMQLVSLGVKWVGLVQTEGGRSGKMVFTTRQEMELGSEENVLVFLLDTVDPKTVRNLLDTDETALYAFRDFTWFDNSSSNYLFTFPSVVNLLTGAPYNSGEQGYSDYMKEAWLSPKAVDFWGTLQQAGFRSNLYMEPAEITSNAEDLSSFFDNITDTRSGLKLNPAAFKNLYKLSFYRYMPLIMKAPFWIYTGDIASVLEGDGGTIDPWSFARRINQEELVLGREPKRLAFHYMQGTHFPWLMDADGKLVYAYDSAEYTSAEEQLRGHFNLLAVLFSQMRNLGVYDSSTIIVMSDHGNNEGDSSDVNPLFMVKRPYSVGDALKVSHAPVVTQEQFMPTILSSLGLDDPEFGVSAFDLDETPVERCSLLFALDESLPKVGGSRFNAFQEYCWTGENQILNEKIKTREFGLIPLKDSFY